MRLLRKLLLLELGAWIGMATAAAFVKRAVPSRGDEESDELGLVAVLGGVELVNHSPAFRGGSMLAWLGGVDVDLREAQLAPDAHLSVHALLGGISIRIPEGWRVEWRIKAVAGGVHVQGAPPDDAEAPVLTIDGLAVLGGVAVVAGAGAPQPE